MAAVAVPAPTKKPSQTMVVNVADAGGAFDLPALLTAVLPASVKTELGAGLAGAVATATTGALHMIAPSMWAGRAVTFTFTYDGTLRPTGITFASPK